MAQRRIIAWLCLVFVAALVFGFFFRMGAAAGAADAPSAIVAATGDVSVYKGVERPGLERRACGFKDGIFIARAELSAQRVIVTDPLNHEFYRSNPIPDLFNYVPQQLTCNRSAQTGKLVITVGGFYAGTSTSQSLTLATDYAIREEVKCEENPGCVP